MYNAEIKSDILICSIPGGTTSIRVTYEESSLKYCIINKLPISWFNIYKRYFHCFWQFV